jgi:hypothetical protein
VLALLAASALALSCDVGLASLNGMLIPVRAMGWVWIALMLPMVLLGTDRAKASLALGGAGLLWMLVLGVIAWSDFYRVRAPAGNYVYALAATLSEIPGDRQVVLVDDVTRIRSMRVMNNKPGLQMRMALLKIRGIHARACEPAFCDAVKAYVRRQRIGALAFQYQGRQVVYFRPGASLAVPNGTTRLLP